MPRKPHPGRRGERAGGEQRFGHPLGVAAVPPSTFGAAGRLGQVILDLPGCRGPQFSDGGHDVLGQLWVRLDDVFAPPSVPVFAHPPAHQGPIVDSHQRGLVRPVLHQQPRRTGAVRPRRTVEHVPVVGPEPAEDRRVVGAHRDRHRIELQHLDARDQPPQVRAGDWTDRLGLAKALCRNGYPPGLRGGQARSPDGHALRIPVTSDTSGGKVIPTDS